MKIEMLETDKAWLAGFFDGEGCISVRKQISGQRYNPTYSISITVTNTSKLVMDYLVKLCGSYYKTELRKAGRVGNRKDCYYWQICSEKAKMLLEIILPYLVLKKEQAINAIKLDDSVRRHKGKYRLSNDIIMYRESLYNKSRLLNRRGRCELV